VGRLGVRETSSVRDERATWWCVCTDPGHHLSIWFGDDWLGAAQGASRDSDFGEWQLEVARQWLPLRQRLRYCWRYLSGRETRLGIAWLLLNYRDAVTMRDELNRIIERIEAATVPAEGPGVS
jgi:hypothetical protein